MTLKDLDKGEDIFDGGLYEWTPRSADQAVFVLYAPIKPGPEVSNHCASVLSDAELNRADRFLTEAERENYIQRRAFRRRCGALAIGFDGPLSKVVFEETEKGRPYLLDSPDIWFSFSSCRLGFLGAWSLTIAVGVDIEDRTMDLDACEVAAQYFTEAEKIAVEDAKRSERLRTFYKLWCLKEAALKSIGEGLPAGLAAFEFELLPDLRIVDTPREKCQPDDFDSRLIEGADYCSALVARTLAGSCQQRLG